MPRLTTTRNPLAIYADDDLVLHGRNSPIESDHVAITQAGRGYWSGDSVGDSAVDDAGADARREAGGGADVSELTDDVLAVQAGPGEEPACLVGEGRQGALAAVGEGGDLGGAAVDDGSQVAAGPAPAGRSGGGGTAAWAGAVVARRISRANHAGMRPTRAGSPPRSW